MVCGELSFPFKGAGPIDQTRSPLQARSYLANTMNELLYSGCRAVVATLILPVTVPGVIDPLAVENFDTDAFVDGSA